MKHRLGEWIAPPVETTRPLNVHLILFDFSDSEWHFTFEGAVKIANAYPNALLLLCHWGSVDSPDFAPFNGDPKKLYDVVVNPDRIKVLAPGEPFVLKRFKK